MPPKPSEVCTDKEEYFCQLVVYSNMSYHDAMIEAGWSKNTVKSRGTKYVAERPRVAKRLIEMKQEVYEKKGGKITPLDTVFLSVSRYVEDAIDVLSHLMHNAESEAVRQRSAATLLETGKGILIAQMPKRVTFEVRMSELALEAKNRLESGEVIDVTPEDGEDAAK